MSDYSTGKIYKIFVEGADEFCYIGSTIITLTQRLSKHKSLALSDAQYKFASAPFFQEGNNVLIELLEDYPCNSKQELLTREAYWLLQFPEALNINTPILDAEERHKRANAICLKNYYENKEHRMKSHKEWLETNKEKIAKQRATPEHLAHESAMRKKRMEDPEYAKILKEKMAAIKKEKVECPVCKKIMNKNSLWTHTKSVHP